MKSREKRAWHDMKTRCYNPKFNLFHRYGGRGIRVCAQWEESFDAFLYDMGECPSGHSLDRINNDGDYEPENCRWASPKEQARNTRRNKYLTLNGETLTVAEWAEKTGMSQFTLYERINNGFSDEECLLTPIDRKHYATFGGETLSLMEWSGRLGVDVDTLRIRLKRWPLEKALTTSKLHNGGRKPLGMSQHCESLGS